MTSLRSVLSHNE